jgi:NTE family protein
VPWNPSAVRDRLNLHLSDTERQAILRNFDPLAPGQLKADGVFEGGGVLGIAFLGALRCCDEIGLRWADLAGTSAGAITAALLAANYTLDELDGLLGSLDYMRFISAKTSRLILTGDPSDDLGDDLPRLLFALWTTRQMGEYSTQPFQEWISEVLGAKQVRRFADVEAKGRKLKVVASDISRGLMLVLPDSLALDPYDKDGAVLGEGPAQFEVGRAVRLSMSIPLFFEPGELAGSAIVDGGITSNFPLWIYDAPPGEAPPYPTFGFRLVDKEAVPKVRDAVDVLRGMITTMRFAHDRFFLQAKELGRVINIDLTGVKVTATTFNLTDTDKDTLYARGYQAARDFFLNHWSWTKHLAARGFAPDGRPLTAPRPGG